MNKLSYNPKREIVQILGSLLNNNSLIDSCNLDREDFPEMFHRIIYLAIKRLRVNGIELIDEIIVDDFLSYYEKQYRIFQLNQGIDYLIECKKRSRVANFKYNVNRIKKCTLLNTYEFKNNVKLDYDITIIDDFNTLEDLEQYLNKTKERSVCCV